MSEKADFSNVKVGDKLVQEHYNYWTQVKTYAILEVVKITPKGHFRMNNNLLIKNDGTSSGGYFQPITPELEKEMKKWEIIRKAQDVMYDLMRISRNEIKELPWEAYDLMIEFAPYFKGARDNTVQLKQLIEEYRKQHPEEAPECIKCFSSHCCNYSENEPNNCREYFNIIDCKQYMMEGH